MKLKSPGEPGDDGRYNLPRDIVIKTLESNGVDIRPMDDRGLNLFLLTKGDKFSCEVLPPIIAIRKAIKLAKFFSFLPDEFYKNNNSLH